MKLAGPLLLLLALGACTLSVRYRKPDTPEDYMRQDYADCTASLAKRKDSLGEQEYQEQLDSCMVGKGYFVGW